MEINFKNTDDQRKKLGLALPSHKKEQSSVFGSKPKGGIFGAGQRKVNSIMGVKNTSNYDQNLALEQSKVLAQDSQAYEYDAVYDNEV